MRVLVVGLGNQGRKRLAVAGSDVVATVDPLIAEATFRSVEQVPLNSYDSALVCTPDQMKFDAVLYLLGRAKHVLVEKPLLDSNGRHLMELAEQARAGGAACYTAYNHRFEPHVARLKELLDSGALGKVYRARLVYGNGTARDVKDTWRDEGLGVVSDLGSHLLDLVLYLFGPRSPSFEAWSLSRHENRAFDHVLFGSNTSPVLELEATFLSWRNTFAIEVIGELGSAHVAGLTKWGASTLTLRRRVFPSGVPGETVEVVNGPDLTWQREYEHFKQLCRSGGTNIENDQWISSVLQNIEKGVRQAV